MQKYLSLEYLNTFMIAVETKKLNVTAELTSRSASAVSTQIKNLEAQVGKPLFIRNKSSLTITKEGELLAEYANKLLTINEEFFAKVDRKDTYDTVAFGVPTDYTKMLVEDVYPVIEKEFPDQHYSVISSRSRELRRMLNERKIDGAIVAMEPQYYEDIFLWDEELYWVSSKDYFVKPYRKIAVAVFSDNCVMNNYAQFCLERVSFSYEIQYKSIDMKDIAQFVASGMAIALLPKSMITDGMSIVSCDLITCPYRLKIGFAYTEKLPKPILNRIVDIIRE